MQITILGEQLNIQFNMATQLAYENITGTPFNLDDLSFQKNSIALNYAAIISNNPSTSITFDDILYKATGQDIKTLSSAVIDAIQEWATIPAVMASADQPTQPAEEEESPKN